MEVLPEGKNKSGGQEKPFDWSVFDMLCAVGCMLTEIAEYMAVSPDTIERRCKDKGFQTFAAYRDTKFGRRKAMLRAKQFETALAGNVTMMIWLGKNCLGQSDKISHEVDVAPKNITLNYTVKNNKYAKAVEAEVMPKKLEDDT